MNNLTNSSTSLTKESKIAEKRAETKFVITGGKKLGGTIHVSGAKNAATPIIAATLLTDEECIISNVPRIADVDAMLAMLESLGSVISWIDEHTVSIKNKGASLENIDYRLMKRLRSSTLLMGPFLTRFSEGKIAEPGGCIIGNRPLDTHLHGLQKLGATIERTNGHYMFSSTGLVGASVVLLEASVTATENVLMAATRARGVTTIKNAACEPHVKDLSEFLIAMGADIEGVGTPTLVVRGKDVLHGAHHSVIPDTIEAGTFLILGAACKSEIFIKDARADHMDVVLEKLWSMGVRFEIHPDGILTKHSSGLLAAKVNCQPYPGIPTDLQSLFGVLATQAHGTSLIHDTMFEGRLGYIHELVKMGANAVVCDPHRVLISGPTPLYGQDIRSYDLRAGAALIVAGLIASGPTTIYDADIIDRGYERIEERLCAIGADIERID